MILINMKYSGRCSLSLLVIIFCGLNAISCNTNPDYEWTDPSSGTYYNIASLKKDPK